MRGCFQAVQLVQCWILAEDAGRRSCAGPAMQPMYPHITTALLPCRPADLLTCRPAKQMVWVPPASPWPPCRPSCVALWGHTSLSSGCPCHASHSLTRFQPHGVRQTLSGDLCPNQQ